MSRAAAEQDQGHEIRHEPEGDGAHCQLCSRSCTSMRNWWKCTRRLRRHGASAKKLSISIDLPVPTPPQRPDYTWVVDRENGVIQLKLTSLWRSSVTGIYLS